MTPEIQQKIAILRQKTADNTITIDELKEGIALMREGRKQMQAASPSKSRNAKAKAAIPSADDMLDELGK